MPVAFSSGGAIVLPVDAVPGQEYRCPGCGSDLVFRRGGLRRPHFAHRRGQGCAPDSLLHRAAKQRIVEVIDEWKRGEGPRPCVARECPTYDCNGGVTQYIPEEVTHALQEVRLPDGSVADVVLFRGDEPAAAIEVLATHRVSPEKAGRMTLPWVELRASEVLDRPYWWVAVQDGLQPFTCPSCAKRGEARSESVLEVSGRALVVAERLDLALPPTPPYRYVPHECWRCGFEMLVFLWPGGGGHSPKRPPEPIPSSVQHRVTEGSGNYWANCCPSCSAIQGDYYLVRDNEDYLIVREHADEMS